MRKAALILGIIAAVFMVSGGIMKLAGLPGGNICMVAGMLIFIGFSVVLMVVQLKESTHVLGRLAAIAGLLTALTLGTGLLGLGLHWPGMTLSMIGLVFAAAFIGTFFAAREKQPGKKMFGAFTLIVVLVYLSLGMGWVDGEQEKKRAEEALARYEALQEKYVQLNAKVSEQFEPYRNDTLDDGADRLYHESVITIFNVGDIKEELINAVNGYESYEGFYLAYPLDIDSPTYLLVGEDPANPTGRGKELYAALKEYRAQLSPEIKLDIDLSFDIAGQDWVYANFYHVTAIDAVARLTEMQVKILEAESAAFERHAFVNN